MSRWGSSWHSDGCGNGLDAIEYIVNGYDDVAGAACSHRSRIESPIESPIAPDRAQIEGKHPTKV